MGHRVADAKTPLIASVQTWLVRTGEQIAEAIRRRDTSHAIFHGCYDWHSACHGHWALLRIARVTGEQQLADAALAELTPDRIAVEAQHLRQLSRFEMPYGRAWFLRLAIEHAAVTGDDRLRAMADEVATSLVVHYESVAPHPDTREYDNASWALAQLHAYGRATDNASLTATVQRHVEAHFLDAGEVSDLGVDHQRHEFFSPRGNWLYLIATTQPAETLGRVLREAALAARTLRPVAVARNRAHSFGINWSRAWMLHRLARVAPVQRELFQTAYDDHVDVALAEHDVDRGSEDYFLYGHWVPQFAVYALTEDAN